VNVQNRKVLDVVGARDAEGQNVQVYNRHNRPNQRWTIVYLDKKGKERHQGKNTQFGFFIRRPFYIESRMPMRRVIEVVGGRNLVIKSRVYNRRTQLFVFDQVSKTIQSQAYRGKSFDIQNAGRSNNL
jgi:hypothetical protein